MKFDWKEFLGRLWPALLAALLAGLGLSTPMMVRGCRQPDLPPPQPAPPEPSPPNPRPPEPPKPEPSRVDAWKSIGRLAMERSFCSGTVVGPRRSDGRWYVVSAAHCFDRVGQAATFIPREGASFRCSVQGIDRRSDCAVLVSDTAIEVLYHTFVSDSDPAAGTVVWHGGYGQDRPGNKESGQVVRGPNQDGQVQYRVSVSPGDSGGGIVVDASGRLLSPVCCTTCLGCTGDVWGAGPAVIKRMLAAPTDYIDLPPATMPPPPVAAAPMPPPKD